MCKNYKYIHLANYCRETLTARVMSVLSWDGEDCAEGDTRSMPSPKEAMSSRTSANKICETQSLNVGNEATPFAYVPQTIETCHGKQRTL